MAKLELIADIMLLVASALALVLMLMRDVCSMRQCGFSTASFYKYVTDTEEYLSVWRIMLLVIFVASLTVMALSSAYVVVALALAVAATDVAAWRKRQTLPSRDSHAVRLLAAATVLLLILAAVAAIRSGLYYGAVAALGMATFSYAATLTVNWLMQPFERKNSQISFKQQKTTDKS